MKDKKLFLFPALAVILWIFYVAAAWNGDWFGFDQLRYLPKSFLAVSSLLFIVILFAGFAWQRNENFGKFVSSWFWVVLGAGWLALLIRFRTGAPLLGDGYERIAGLPSGLLKVIGNQPAPLDIFLHWAAYRFISLFISNGQYLAYALLSYLAGVAYYAAAVILAPKLFEAKPARLIFVLILLLMGYVQMFAGYAENYSFIAAGFLFWMIALFESENGNMGMLVLSQIILILLHFFFLLLLPVTIWVLWKKAGRRSYPLVLLSAAFGAAVAILAALIVHKSYRGPAIFLNPMQVISFAHLADFINYQMLACPAVFILLAALILSRKESPLSLSERALAIASVIFVVFFFVLRPVLGAVRDWDLFSIPAMVYTPFLLIYFLSRTKSSQRAMNLFAAGALSISLAATCAWLFVNHSEKTMINRIDHHLEARQARENWACSYGFLIQAKWFASEGKNENADQAFRKAIEINPGYSVNHQEFGIFLWKSGNMQESLKQMEIAHGLNPTNPQIKITLANFYFAYAKSLMGEGKIPEAEKYLQKLFELVPDWPPAISALADFYQNTLPDPQKADYYRKMLK